MATSDIIYTIGILLAVLIVLILARSVVIRRSQRLANAQVLPFHSRRHLGVPPDAWNWESPTIQRPEPAVTRHVRTTTSTSPPPNGETESIAEQLPRYEAPPPEYDVVVKNNNNNPADREHVEDTAAAAAAEPVEMRYLDPAEAGGHPYGTEQGEGSSTTAAATVATSDQGQSPPYSTTAETQHSGASGAPERSGGIGQQVGRAWGRMFRR